MFGLPASLGNYYKVGAITIPNNYSLGFRGTNGYVGIGKPSNLNFNPSSDSFTVSIWFKPGAFDFQRCILAKANMDGGLPGIITIFIGINTDGSLYCLVGGGENTSGGNTNDGNWHLATVVVTGGQAKLYLDNAQVGSTFSVGAGQNTLADWLIGGSRYTNNADISYPWKGLIDEPTFWNTAFSLADVVSLYNSGKAIDPRTHVKSGNLLHWYRMGDDLVGDLIPTIKDQISTNDGTIFNTYESYLFNTAPNYVPSVLDSLTTALNCDMQFDANNWSGSGNWSSTVGSWTGVVTSSPVKQSVGQFTGRSEITNAGWFRIAANGNHTITASTVMTYVLRMKTGAEDGSGGFYFGFDGETTNSDFQIYNFFYAEDAAARIRNPSGATNYLAAEAHGVQNQNKYSTIHVVIDMPNTTLKVYVNGGLLISTNSTSGSFTPPATAPLGILGVAKISAGGDVSTASGQTVIEVARYRQVLTDVQVARQAATFNSLKGYI